MISHDLARQVSACPSTRPSTRLPPAHSPSTALPLPFHCPSTRLPPPFHRPPPLNAPRASLRPQLRRLCASHATLGRFLCAFRTWRRQSAAAGAGGIGKVEIWRRALGMATAAALQGAWHAWREAAQFHRAGLALLSSCAEALGRHGCQRWLRCAHANALASNAAKRAVRYWLRQRLAAAWYALGAHQQNQQRLSRAVLAMGGESLNLRASVQRWAQTARTQREQLTAARRAANVLRGRSEALCFGEWVDAHRARALRRTESGFVMARVARRWQLAKAGAALRSWAFAWRASRILEAVLRDVSSSVGAHIDERVVRQAVQRWRWISGLSNLPRTFHGPSTDLPLTFHGPSTDLPRTFHGPSTDLPLTFH